MPHVDRVRHQLDTAADAFAARRSLYAALTALAADPFDLGHALSLPALQRRVRDADHALAAVIQGHRASMGPYDSGAAAAEGVAPPGPGGSHRPTSGLTAFQRILAASDTDTRPSTEPRGRKP